MTRLSPLPQVEHELRLGLKSKIDETEAMWHMLNTMFKNIEREYRYVDAIVKSLEANGEQGEKHGIGAVTAACLEVKMRKVKVHKAYEVDAPISAEEASREDGVLTLLHGETQEQLKMRALFRANLVEARETHAVLQSFREEISQAMADKTKALAIERECLMLGATSDLEVISRDGGLPNDTTLLQGRNALPSTVGGPSPSPPATHRLPPTIRPNQAEMLSDLRNATSRSGQLALSPTKGAHAASYPLPSHHSVLYTLFSTLQTH